MRVVLNLQLAAVAVFVWSSIAIGGEIHDTTKAGDIEKIKALLKQNPKLINSKDEGGASPLHWAVGWGTKSLVEFLLANNADVNARDDNGLPPIQWAVDMNSKEMIELLLANKAEIDAKDNHGRTPLYWAVYRGKKLMVETLLEHKADVNAKDARGITPLQFALRGSRAWADPPSEKEKLNWKKACEEIAELLRKYGAKE